MSETPEQTARRIVRTIDTGSVLAEPLHGTFGYVFRVRRTDASTFILKFNRDPGEDFLSQEILIHRYLASVGIPVPAVLATHLDTPVPDTDEALPYLAMEDVAGLSLHESLQSYPEASHEILDAVGAALRRIHSLNPLDVPTEFTARESMRGRQDNLHTCERMARDFGWSEAPIVECLQVRMMRLSEPLTRFVHHDMHPRQLLVTESRKCVVIDWSDAGAGEDSDDMGHLLARGVKLGWPREWRTQLLDGYYEPTGQLADRRRYAVYRAAFELLYGGLFALRDGDEQQALSAKALALELLADAEGM